MDPREQGWFCQETEVGNTVITETMRRANTCLTYTRLWIQASLPRLKKKKKKPEKSKEQTRDPCSTSQIQSAEGDVFLQETEKKM